MALPPETAAATRTPNRVDAFRAAQGSVAAGGGTLLGGIFDGLNAWSNTVAEKFGAGTDQQAAGTVAGTLTGAIAPMASAGISTQMGRIAPPGFNTGNAAQQSILQSPALTAAGMTAGGLPVGAMYAYDTGLRGVNTAIGGTTLLGGAGYTAGLNALTGNDFTGPNSLVNADGFQLSDVLDTYSMVWGKEEMAKDKDGYTVLDGDGKPVMVQNAITSGQALALTIGRSWFNLADAIVPADLQSEVNKKILEDTDTALKDPSNSRGLYSWMSGLYSEFDVGNYQQRESAFNQGLGRWISGSTDAAVQWFLGPDVLALKVAGKAGRSLFMQSLDDFANVDKMAENLALHAEHVTTGGASGKKTAIGRLAESFVKMDELTASKHKLATASNQQSLVGRVLGRAKTYEEVQDGLLAMSGHKGAIDKILAKDAIAGDALRRVTDDIAEQMDILNHAAEGETRVVFGLPVPPSTVKAFSSARIQQLDGVLQQAIKENKDLEAVVAGINKEAGIASDLLPTSFSLSKLPYGANSVERMARQAEKSVSRSEGSMLWKETEFKAGGVGRTIRVIRSGADFAKTNRIRGFARLNDSNDVIAELDASMMTLPMFRSLAKQGPDALMPGSEDITVAAFRNKYQTWMVNARTATERHAAWTQYETAVWNALANHYNVSPDLAKSIVARYEDLRVGLKDQIVSKGWFEDNSDIVVTPDLQSMLAETHQTMDFHFIEQIFRMEQGSALSSGRLHGGKALDWMNSIWRPLVLMRLGYTQRNVAEGWLRELAAYGSFGPLYDRGLATRGIDESDKQFVRWAQSFGHRMDRLASLRYGKIKKIRRELDSATAVTTARARRVREREAIHTDYLGDLTRRHDTALSDARRAMTSETAEKLKEHAGVVWENADTVARGRMTEYMDGVSEILIPPENIRPFINGMSSRRSNVASGYDNATDSAVAQTMADPEGKLYTTDTRMYPSIDAEGAPPVTGLLRFSPSRSEHTALLGKESKGLLTDAERARLEELNVDAHIGAARNAMRTGDRVVRLLEGGRYEVVHNPMEITAADVLGDAVHLLPKENLDKITHVRARVAGGTYDLRVKPVEIDRAKLTDLSDRMSSFSYLSGGDLDQEVWDLYHSVMGPGRGLDAEPSDALKELNKVFALAEENPQVARALALKQAAGLLPRHIQDDLIKRGVLITSKELKRLSKEWARLNKAAPIAEQDARLFRQQLEDRWATEEFWAGLPAAQDNKVIAFHCVRRVPKDKLDKNPKIDNQAHTLLVGPGFYTTEDPMVGSSYLIGKALGDIGSGTGEPVFYAVKAPKGVRDSFVNLEHEIVPGSDEHNELLNVVDEFDIQISKLLNEQHMGGRITEEDDFLDFLEGSVQNNPIRGTNPNFEEYRLAAFEVIGNELRRNRADWTAEDLNAFLWEAWINAAKENEIGGVRHMGGGSFTTFGTPREHQVYVWYTPPKLTRVDELSDDAIELMRLERRADKIMADKRATGVQESFHRNTVPYDAKSLDASYMTPPQMQLLSTWMAKEGIGTTIISDTSSPNGYRHIVNPDMMSVAGDSADAVLPGSLKGGKDWSDKLFRQFQGDAMQDDAFYPLAADRAQLLAEMGGDQAAVDFLVGAAKTAPPESKARIARYMEVNGHSHVSTGTAEKPEFLSAAELIGQREVGTAYGAALGMDEVGQRAQLILANDPQFQKLLTEEQSIREEVEYAQAHFTKASAETKRLSDKLAKRIGKQAEGKQVRPKLGSGTEVIRYKGGDLEMDGPFSTNEQGSMWMQLAGADDRVQTELYGYTDFNYRNLRRKNIPVEYIPGDQYYFQTMAEQANKLWRNDPVGLALAEGKGNDEIMDILFSNKRGQSWLRNSPEFKPFKNYVSRDLLTQGAREDMDKIIQLRREIFEETFPDPAVRARIAEGDVNADYLRTQLAWRGDLKSLQGLGLAHAHQGLYRTMTGNIMHVLGTLPENTLVRHPFFRARWREEMQRQANLYYDQGMTEFTHEQINAMNQVAKKSALRQTNDTLYTIQRMSTPAHTLRFVMPFFPAWASSMKFWLGKVPLRQPQNIARYAMAFNSPESAGFVYDNETGQKIEGSDTLAGKVINKFSGADNGSIIVQVNPNVADKLKGILGDNARISIGKGTLDMMLQGQYFWLPSFGPIMAIPASWLSAQMPDMAAAMETGNITQGRIPEVDAFVSQTEFTKAIYQMAVPFGAPTKEKNLLNAIAEQVLPAGMQKFETALRGEDSPEFRNAANSIYRDMQTDYELGGSEGERPSFLDAVAQARTFWTFRGLVNYIAPFAPGFTSKYQFYIDEWQRLQADADRNGTGYDDAQQKFLNMYGPTFWRYTQSLSGGSSGIGPTVKEFNVAKSDPTAIAELASIGEDASFASMLTKPFADRSETSFSTPVYSYQYDRPIEGAPGKYFRGGNQGVQSEVKSQKDLGWFYYNKGMVQFNAALAVADKSPNKTKSFDDFPALAKARHDWMLGLAAQYPDWYDDQQDIGGNRWFRANTALDAVLASETYAKNADMPYFKALSQLQKVRDAYSLVLQKRNENGGSASLDAASNKDVAKSWAVVTQYLVGMDPTGRFEETFNRFFASDNLKEFPMRSAGG